MRPPAAGVAHVLEDQAPEAGSSLLGPAAGLYRVEAIGGDEGEAIRVLGVPGAVLGAQELGYPCGLACGLQISKTQRRDIAEVDQAKTPALAVAEGGRAVLIAEGRQDLDTIEPAAEEPGLMDLGAAARLLPIVQIHLAGAGIV
ncbi:MAG: hypothetical protein ACR2M4_06365 [Actinomycetota bacterium]